MTRVSPAFERKTNQPAPAVDSYIAEELTRLGGLVPEGYGVHSGKPAIILLWGQTATAFEAGRMRLRFYDQDSDPVYRDRKYRVTAAGMEQLRNLIAVKTAKLAEAYKTGDWQTYHALLFTSLEYFFEKHIPPSEWERLPEDSSYERTAKLLPDGWFYLEDVPEVTEIGAPNFFVCRWVPPFLIDTPENWERARFGVQPIIDFKGQMQFVDILGEYPRHGEYFDVMLKIEGSPTRQNCLEPIERLLYEARRRDRNQSRAEVRTADRRRAAMEIEAESAKANRALIEEMIHEKGRIIVRGQTATVYRRDGSGAVKRKPKEVIKIEDIKT